MAASLARRIFSKTRFGFGFLQQQSRAYSYEGDGKTTVTILNHEVDSPLMVDCYYQTGFTLNNGMNVIGPIALFPKTVLAWDVKSAKEVNVDSFSLFLIMEPKLDILVIGVGSRDNKIDPKVLDHVRRAGISVEVLPTDHACTTYNFLNVERRAVAAALIPPQGLKPYITDREAQARRGKDSSLSEDVF